MRNDSLPFNDPAGLGVFLVLARALAPAPFEPDRRGLWNARDSGRQPAPPANVKRDPARTTNATGSDSKPLRRQGFLERLERWFWAQQQRDIEAYLAQSADIHDLEQRMRNLERSAWHRYN